MQDIKGKQHDAGVIKEPLQRLLRSSTMPYCDSFRKSPIKNIGSLDQLGNFQLDPKIKYQLDDDNATYWERIKKDLFQKSEKEVMNEATKIIHEVLGEVDKFTPRK